MYYVDNVYRVEYILWCSIAERTFFFSGVLYCVFHNVCRQLEVRIYVCSTVCCVYNIVYFIMCVAGSCITSDDYVERDIFYDGNSIMERATVISRIAPSFIRYHVVLQS